MFLPHMSGSHCPVVDHRSLGAFVGLRNIVTKGDMLRAIIEGLDYQFLQIVRGFESGLGVRPERIVAIGGAINNDFWMQNKADVVGRPIEVPELDEAVPLGAAILAGIGVGLYRDEQDAFDRVYKPGRTYEPDPDADRPLRGVVPDVRAGLSRTARPQRPPAGDAIAVGPRLSTNMGRLFLSEEYPSGANMGGLGSMGTAASALLFCTAALAAAGEEGPAGGDYGPSRAVVSAPADARYAHLAWPKVVRTREGTLVLAYVAGRAHTVDGCPAVSRSTDGGRTFSPPHVLREFSSRADYAHCGNVALGLAGDGAVVLLAMAFTGDERNTIFGWRSTDAGRTWQSADTSTLAENRTGSVYGHVFRVPGKGLAVCGHYRKPSQPHSQGIWIAFSKDEGKTWGAAQRITSEKLVEPAMLCTGGRLVGLLRDAARPHRYWQAISEDRARHGRSLPARSPTPQPAIRSPVPLSRPRRTIHRACMRCSRCGT